METWRWRHGDGGRDTEMEVDTQRWTWRLGDVMETRRWTWRLRDGHGDSEMSEGTRRWTWSHGDDHGGLEMGEETRR
jgi:hypothetical protein